MQQPQQRVREVMWTPHELPGLDHLRLIVREQSATNAADIAIFANGLIIGIDEHQPFRIQYRIACDSRWRVRTMQLSRLDGAAQPLAIGADGAGHWYDNSGVALPALDDCVDIDLSATPFTNTLPIRRLTLQPGVSAEITTAYVQIPSLELSTSHQRYERLADGPDGAVYRFTALASGYTADLTVDADGLVIEYPDLFHRVWSK
ncbi:MAG: putative glycolipid-binding domain-containing protein [Ktedonobacterales bacterium]